MASNTSKEQSPVKGEKVRRRLFGKSKDETKTENKIYIATTNSVSEHKQSTHTLRSNLVINGEHNSNFQGVQIQSSQTLSMNSHTTTLGKMAGSTVVQTDNVIEDSADIKSKKIQKNDKKKKKTSPKKDKKGKEIQPIENPPPVITELESTTLHVCASPTKKSPPPRPAPPKATPRMSVDYSPEQKAQTGDNKNSTQTDKNDQNFSDREDTNKAGKGTFMKKEKKKKGETKSKKSSPPKEVETPRVIEIMAPSAFSTNPFDDVEDKHTDDSPTKKSPPPRPAPPKTTPRVSLISPDIEETKNTTQTSKSDTRDISDKEDKNKLEKAANSKKEKKEKKEKERQITKEVELSKKADATKRHRNNVALHQSI